MSDKEHKAHSSYAVWRIAIDRAIQKVVPGLAEKSHTQLIFSIIMIFVVLVSAVGGGIYVDGYVIHPPKTYTGKCSPPAYISKNDCLQKISVLTTISGQVTTTTQTVETGTILESSTNITRSSSTSTNTTSTSK